MQLSAWPRGTCPIRRYIYPENCATKTVPLKGVCRDSRLRESLEVLTRATATTFLSLQDYFTYLLLWLTVTVPSRQSEPCD